MTSRYSANNRPDKVAKRRFIKEYKLKHGCSVCGYNKCSEALEFDHVERDKKAFNISRAYLMKWERLHDEIAKCVLLCSNCHREKTTREKDYMEVDFEEPEDLQLDLL